MTSSCASTDQPAPPARRHTAAKERQKQPGSPLWIALAILRHSLDAADSRRALSTSAYSCSYCRHTRSMLKFERTESRAPCAMPSANPHLSTSSPTQPPTPVRHSQEPARRDRRRRFRHFPPTAVATTGTPAAIDSSMTFDKLSEVDGTTETSKEASTAGISLRSPQNWTFPSSPRSRHLFFQVQLEVAHPPPARNQDWGISRSTALPPAQKCAMILVLRVHTRDHADPKCPLCTAERRRQPRQTPPAAKHCQ